MNILYLDDDALNRLIVSRAVEKKHKIDTVETPTEFFELADKNKYDIFLIDINLNDPEIDGFGVLEKIKTMGLQEAIFIAHTNYFGEEWEKRCIESGFDHYLSKPFMMPIFEDIIK